MGTFAEAANVDYRVSFADQGKQTYVFYFVSIYTVYINIYIHNKYI